MVYPDRFSDLPAYAFPRLRALLDAHAPGGDVVHMTIGEPKHAFPPWIVDVIAQNAAGFNNYPPNEGAEALRTAFADWAQRRYGVPLDPAKHVLPTNGTRESLYNITMALCPGEKNGCQATVLMPNPFYQVYMLAAISIGAEPILVPATEATGHLPDFGNIESAVLDQCVGVYICSPSNPQGAVASVAYLTDLLNLAEKHDFKIFADECYSEIYRDAPPPGILEVARDIGADPDRVVAFHSLSKRSNLPGLRSGFVTSGARSIKEILQLRTYAGAPLPLPLQAAATAVWEDEEHVDANRAQYVEKYKIADEILKDIPGYASPDAGFFLWLPVPDGEAAALKLWQQTGTRVLPGAYLARNVDGLNPGDRYIRAALVAPNDEVRQGLEDIRTCLYEKE